MPFLKSTALKGSNYLSRGMLLSILLLIILVPFCILALYNHPTYQDYFEAWFTSKLGPWGAQKFFYESWQGRYTESFLQSFNPLTFRAYWPYKANPIILITLLVISSYFLFRQLFSNLTFTVLTAITSLFVISFFALMPEISSGVYWQTGMDDNFIPNVLTIFILLNIISYYTLGEKSKNLIVASVLIIITNGCYDIHMMFIDITVSLILLLSILRKQKLRLPITLFIVCVVSSLVSVIAPGNRNRTRIYPYSHQLMPSIKKTLYWGTDILLHWHWLLFMLLITFLLIELLLSSKVWNEKNKKFFSIHPLLCLLISIGIVYLGIFCFYWAEGRQDPQMNLMNGVYFYYTAAMFYFSFSLLKHINEKHPQFKISIYLRAPLYIVLIYLVLFKPNNITFAYHDITSGAAANHDRERTAIENYLDNSTADSCKIDSIRSNPRCLPNFDYVGGMSGDGNTHFYMSECCSYYHKKCITLKH